MDPDDHLFSAAFLFDSGENVTISLPVNSTVDQVKKQVFRQSKTAQDYSGFWIGLTEGDLLTVEFARFLRAHDQILKNFEEKKPIQLKIIPKSSAWKKPSRPQTIVEEGKAQVKRNRSFSASQAQTPRPKLEDILKADQIVQPQRILTNYSSRSYGDLKSLASSEFHEKMAEKKKFSPMKSNPVTPVATQPPQVSQHEGIRRSISGGLRTSRFDPNRSPIAARKSIFEPKLVVDNDLSFSSAPLTESYLAGSDEGHGSLHSTRPHRSSTTDSIKVQIDQEIFSPLDADTPLPEISREGINLLHRKESSHESDSSKSSRDGGERRKRHDSDHRKREHRDPKEAREPPHREAKEQGQKDSKESLKELKEKKKQDKLLDRLLDRLEAKAEPRLNTKADPQMDSRALPKKDLRERTKMVMKKPSRHKRSSSANQEIKVTEIRFFDTDVEEDDFGVDEEKKPKFSKSSISKRLSRKRHHTLDSSTQPKEIPDEKKPPPLSLINEDTVSFNDVRRSPRVSEIEAMSKMSHFSSQESIPDSLKDELTADMSGELRERRDSKLNRFGGFKKTIDTFRHKGKRELSIGDKFEFSPQSPTASTFLGGSRKEKIQKIRAMNPFNKKTTESNEEVSIMERKPTIKRSNSESDLEKYRKHDGAVLDPLKEKLEEETAASGPLKETIDLASVSQLLDDHDMSTPRPLGSRALWFNRTLNIVPPTEEESAFETSNVSSAKGWVVEQPKAASVESVVTHPLELLTDDEQCWFTNNFANQKDFRLVVGFEPSFGPVVVTLMSEGDKKEGTKEYKALVRTQAGDDFVCFPASQVRVSLMKKSPALKEMVRVISPRLCEADLGLYEIIKEKEGFSKDMVVAEERQRSKGFKFGVLYCREGQTKEEDMFGNEHGSPGFERFLETLGDKVALRDWKNFRAGLDVSSDGTGTHSYYTTFGQREIMFHVSTLLPYKKNDVQHLDRKRHLGNDICVVVYREGKNAKYRPNTIESEFNHVVIVVDAEDVDPENPNDEIDRLRVTVCMKEGVPKFGPPSVEGAVFQRNQALREFILKKLMNGEAASLISTTFSSKIRRTRFATLRNLIDSHK